MSEDQPRPNAASSASHSKRKTNFSRTDILLAMSHTPTEDYMQMIISRQKTHEFRTKLYPSTIERIWFYETSPISAITYICEIDQPIIRSPLPRSLHGLSSRMDMRELLDDDGIGNIEYNNYHPDWTKYDYAYPIRSCWKIRRPVSLAMLKGYGLNGAPREVMYVPEMLKKEVEWSGQELVWR